MSEEVTITSKLLDENTREITEKRVRLVDLASLNAQLNALQNIPRPSDEEVLALAKKGEIHPYYDQARQFDIAYLQREIEGEPDKFPTPEEGLEEVQ